MAEKKMEDKQDKEERAKAEAEAAEKEEAEDDEDHGDLDEDEEEEVREEADEEEEEAKHRLKLKAEKLSFWKSLQTGDVHQEEAETGEAEDDGNFDDIDEDEEEEVELETKIEELGGEPDTHRSPIDDQNKGFYQLKKKKDKLQSERNDLCRNEMSLQQSRSRLKEELAKAYQTLRSMAGKPTLHGRDSAKKVLQVFNDRGCQQKSIAGSYYDLVIEQFQCEQSMHPAVEVTAGNRLFHHIAESDGVGTFLLKE